MKSQKKQSRKYSKFDLSDTSFIDSSVDTIFSGYLDYELSSKVIGIIMIIKKLKF